MNLIYTNDIHSNFPDCFNLITTIRKIKKDSDSIVIDGGDFFEGHMFYNLFEGLPDYLIFRDLYDYVVPGNHGFNYVKKLHAEKNNIICCNIFENNECLFNPYVLINDVLIIGIISVDAFNSIETTNRSNLKVKEPIAEIKNHLKKFRYKRNRKVIVISHSGINIDKVKLGHIDEIDLVLSSHCHSEINEIHTNYFKLLKCKDYGRSFIKVNLFDLKYENIENIEKKMLDKDLMNFKKIYNQKKQEFNQIILPKCFFDNISCSVEDTTSFLMKSISINYQVNTIIINKYFIRNYLYSEKVCLEDLFKIIPFDNNIILFHLKIEEYFVFEKKTKKMFGNSFLKFVYRENDFFDSGIIKVITSSYIINQLSYNINYEKKQELLTFREFLLNLLKENDINRLRN